MGNGRGDNAGNYQRQWEKGTTKGLSQDLEFFSKIVVKLKFLRGYLQKKVVIHPLRKLRDKTGKLREWVLSFCITFTGTIVRL